MPTVEEKRAALIAARGQLTTEQKRQQLMSGQSATPLGIKQEMHQDIDFSDRFAIKNFGGDPQTAIDYLKKKKPELQFTTLETGQIGIRRPDEQEWKVLDPEGFDVQDVTDVAYDIPAGILSGALTAGAGLLGGAGSLGVGAIPAAMAAGGASSGGLEYLRQKIGQSLGVSPDTLNMTDIGIATGTGALAPFLLGTGASAGKIAAKAGQEAVGQRLLGKIGQGTLTSMTDADKAIATELLKESQRGIVGKIPGIFGAFSGVGKETLLDASKQAPEAVKGALGVTGKLNMLDAADLLQQKGLDDVIIQQADNIGSKMLDAKLALQKEFSEALDQVGGVDPQPYYQSFENLLKNLEKSALPQAKADAQKLTKELDSLFFRTVEDPLTGEPVKEAIQSLSGQDAMRLKQYLKEMSSTFVDMEGKPTHTKEVMNAANEAMKKLGGDLESLMDKAGGKNLTQRYRDFSQMEREVMPLFEDPNRMYNFLRTADTKTKRFKSQVINKIDKKYDLGIKDSIDQMNVLSVFGDPSWNPLANQGSNTGASIGAGMIGSIPGRLIGRGLGGQMGEKVGHGVGYVAGSKLASPAAAKAFIKTKSLIEDLGLNTNKGRKTVGDFLRRFENIPYKPAGADILSNMYLQGGDEQ